MSLSMNTSSNYSKEELYGPEALKKLVGGKNENVAQHFCCLGKFGLLKLKLLS